MESYLQEPFNQHFSARRYFSFIPETGTMLRQKYFAIHFDNLQVQVLDLCLIIANEESSATLHKAYILSKLYIVKLSNNCQPCQVYSPQDDSWTPIAHMMVPRCEFGLVAVDGCLYAFGGWVGEDIGGR